MIKALCIFVSVRFCAIWFPNCKSDAILLYADSRFIHSLLSNKGLPINYINNFLAIFDPSSLNNCQTSSAPIIMTKAFDPLPQRSVMGPPLKV